MVQQTVESDDSLIMNHHENSKGAVQYITVLKASITEWRDIKGSGLRVPETISSC